RGVERRIGLRGDEVKPADMAVRGEATRTESGRTQAVRVDGRLDVRSALAVHRILVGHHHLTGRADGSVAVIAVAMGAGNVLGRTEASELAEPGDVCPECLNLLSGRGRVADPNAVRAICDRWLVAELG